jgi:hypothetical protein
VELPREGDEPGGADAAPGAATVAPAAAAGAAADPLLATAAELRSGDPARVRAALGSLGAPPPELVPLVISLVGWDRLSADATRALRRVGEHHVGQLGDALLDPEQVFAIRRRMPRALAGLPCERAVEGLVRALADRRFEVRYQTGIALARLHAERPELPIDREAVLEAVLRETRVDRRVWEGQRLLEESAADDTSPFFDELLRRRSSRSLEHVFTLLSLAYPTEPLRVAYRGLHATDPGLKGTALEYLQHILPPSIREPLWPFLSDERPAEARDREMDDVVDDLLRSHESIRLNLQQLRGEDDPGGATESPGT